MTDSKVTLWVKELIGYEHFGRRNMFVNVYLVLSLLLCMAFLVLSGIDVFKMHALSKTLFVSFTFVVACNGLSHLMNNRKIGFWICLCLSLLYCIWWSLVFEWKSKPISVYLIIMLMLLLPIFCTFVVLKIKKNGVSAWNLLQSGKPCKSIWLLGSVLVASFMVVIVENYNRHIDHETNVSQEILVERDDVESDRQMQFDKPYLVDLGLPSGTLWAKYNIGSSSPWEGGNFYSWGEIEPKKIYSQDKYKYSSDDIATVRWGDEYCLPTQADFKELMDNCICEWCDGTYDGVYLLMMLCKSKKNPNAYLCIPATGYMDGDFWQSPKIGCYWTSTLKTDDSTKAMVFTVDKKGGKCNNQDYRYKGYQIRVVCKPKKK